MSINDELCDSSTAFVEWQIDDKFRQCLISRNLQCSAIVEFLDALLTHIRKGPILSREFTKLICAYLYGVKCLASKITLDKTYYDRVRRVLVLYCFLELSMVSCFDEDSTLASDIFTKIELLMQGSNVVAVADVLIDIDEEICSIRSIRSSTIMKIVHRKYLSKSLIGGPIELDDTNFIKNLICFHLWFKAESESERPYVLTMFLSTIKPSLRLRSNPIYAPYLHSYNVDEVDDYKKLLQQPFDQKSLVIAFRQLEMNTDWQHDIQETIFPDSTSDETIVKSEVVVALNLPDEIIYIDDDEDELEISYLSSLYERLNHIKERLNHIKERESKLMMRNNDPIDVIEIIDSDCDMESVIEIPKCNSSINENERHKGSVSELDSSDLFQSSQTSIWMSNRSNLKTCSQKNTVSLQNVPRFQPILRCRSSTTVPLSKEKKVKFCDPPVTATYIFIRRDDDESTNSNGIESTQQTSSNIAELPRHSDLSSVTGPKCNYPYISATVDRSTPPILLTQNDDVNVQHVSSKIKRVKSKKTRSHKLYRKSRTSIENWMKRKHIHTNSDKESRSSERTQSTVHKATKETSSFTAVKENAQQLLACKRCSVILKRCDTKVTPKVKRGRIYVDLRKQQLCDVRNKFISTKPVFEKIKSSKQLDAATSKSVIKKTKRKSRKSKLSSVTQNRKTEVSTRPNISQHLQSQMKDCFISLEKMTNNVLQKTTSTQNSQKRSYNSITNSTNHADSICRISTKSPQLYQIKRSFEKMPANETSTLEINEILAPITPSMENVTVETISNQSERLLSDRLKPPLQTLLPAFEPSTVQSMENEFECPPIVGSDLINQPLNTVSEVESSSQSIELPDQTSDVQGCTFDLVQNENVAIIKSDQQLNRNITNYSSDTTTSSIPQYYAIFGTNFRHTPSNEIIAGITTNVNNPVNIANQLGTLYDDNDIPSPLYSPHAGKRKRCTMQESSNPQITKSHRYKCAGDTNTPIDLSKGNDSKIDKMTVNGVMCNGDDGNVDSAQFIQNRNISLDVVPNDIWKGDKSSAIVEITNDQVLMESNSPCDLPESTWLSSTVNVQNVNKPEISRVMCDIL